jgi:hypothetical protein
MSDFKIGDRVGLIGSHALAGAWGEITNSPGKAFNGWTVRLNSGHYTGAGSAQMVRASAAPPEGETTS